MKPANVPCDASPSGLPDFIGTEHY